MNEGNLKKQKRLEQEQAISRQILAAKEELMREWKLRKAKYEQGQVVIDQQYDNIIAKINALTASIQTKTVEMRKETQKIRSDSELLKKAIAQSKISSDLQAQSDNEEISQKIRLQMQVEDLQKQIKSIEDETKKTEERRAFYQKKWNAARKEIQKIKSYEELSQRIDRLQERREEAFQQYQTMVSKEQARLEEDLKQIREIRDKLIQEKSAQLENPLADRSISETDILGSAYAETNQTNEKSITKEKVDKSSSFRKESPKSDEVKQMEQTLATLLSTGLYNEDDPIILQIQNQIESASAAI